MEDFKVIKILLGRILSEMSGKTYDEIMDEVYMESKRAADELPLDQPIKPSAFEKSLADKLYDLYPSKCVVSGRSTAKSAKDKKRLLTLLKSTSFDLLADSIMSYVKQCEKDNCYMKNFSTFLNNIPIIERETVSKPTDEVEQDNYYK